MHRSLLRTLVWLPAVWAAVAAQAGDQVVLRATSGRFLRVKKNGNLRADRLLPTQQETFDLNATGQDLVTLATPDGRFLNTRDDAARRLRAEPGDPKTLVLIPVDGNRVAFGSGVGEPRVVRNRALPPDAKPPEPVTERPTEPPIEPPIELPTEPPTEPPTELPTERPTELPTERPPEPIVEIYRFTEIPPSLRSVLASVISTLVVKELDGKPYDKDRSRLKKKYVELPAPTLRNLRRKKRHQVYALREEYHVKVQLDGPPKIQIEQMPCLKGYRRPGVSVLMFHVQASVPVRGRVRYKIPGRLSASTGFRTMVRIDLVGQIRAERSGDQVTLSPPELLDIGIQVRSLDLSNDLLNAARRPIEDLINHEIRRKKDRIGQQANKAIHKAVQTQQFRHPLLRYLGFP